METCCSVKLPLKIKRVFDGIDLTDLPPTNSAGFIHDKRNPASKDKHAFSNQGGAVKRSGKRWTPIELWLAPSHCV